mmetsp:Transcript_20365/g.26009  ORF Transcript_20365/g.26009 Transcript_20365/m.26009 type:complete len:197 (-) Transcript_20365:1390-1980(-)
MANRSLILKVTVLVIASLTYLLGLLFNDLIFTLSKREGIAKEYYCTLHETAFAFPQVLRIALPMAFLELGMCFKILESIRTWGKKGVYNSQEGTSNGVILFLLLNACASYATFKAATLSWWGLCEKVEDNEFSASFEEVVSEIAFWEHLVGYTIITSLAIQWNILSNASVATEAVTSPSRSQENVLLQEKKKAQQN